MAFKQGPAGESAGWRLAFKVLRQQGSEQRPSRPKWIVGNCNEGYFRKCGAATRGHLEKYAGPNGSIQGACRRHGGDHQTESCRRQTGGPLCTRRIGEGGYSYPAEHYRYWQKELPEVSFSWGMFGENLTTEGVREDSLRIAGLLWVGSAVLMVTQPRMPCFKLNLRFNRDDMIKRFLMSGRSGLYLSVIEPGKVSVGSKAEILGRDPNRVSVTDIVRLYLGQTSNPELLQRATTVSALPENWKAQLALRAQTLALG